MSERTVNIPAELVDLCEEFGATCSSKRVPGGAVAVMLYCDRRLPAGQSDALWSAQIDALEQFLATMRRRQQLKAAAKLRRIHLEVINGHHLTLTWSDNTVIAECDTLGLSIKWTAPSDRVTAQVMEHGRAMVLEKAKRLTMRLDVLSRNEQGGAS